MKIRSFFLLISLAGMALADGPRVYTFAGSNWKFPTDSVMAVGAPLGKPAGVAVDRDNNVYVADTENFIIARITPAGVLTVMAGNGVNGSTGDGGPAVNAAIGTPRGLALDRDGNIYFTDSSRVRRVGTDGTISTVATGLMPYGVAVDADGNVIVVDWGNSRVKKVLKDGTIVTLAGTGKQESSGDGGLATAASLSYPKWVTLDAAGNIYVTETGGARMINAVGVINTVAGGGYDTADQVLARTGSIISLGGITSDAAGNLFLTAGNFLYKVGTNGMIRKIAGADAKTQWVEGGPALLETMNGAGGVAVDSAGNVYVADTERRRIEMLSPRGTMTTFAGNGNYSYAGDGGPATQAALAGPSGLALDAAGNVLIAEGEYRIRRVDVQGTITTIAGAAKGLWGDQGPAVEAGLDHPYGLTTDSAGNIYVVDAYNRRIRRISPDGTITTVVAPGLIREAGVSGIVSISVYDSVVVDGAGNLYFSERYNNRIRKVSSAGVISTVAGTGTAGFSGDGGPADKAQVSAPGAMVLDGAGNIYFWDAGNLRVRRIGVDGVITTVAGSGARGSGSAGDGGPATAASFGSTIYGLAVDRAGGIYVADYLNRRIRFVTPEGYIQTFAGGGVLRGEGVDATSALLDGPGSLALAADGTLYFAYPYGQKVMAVMPAKQQ